MQSVDMTPIRDFLGTDTPPEWCEAALSNQALLLVDHANCEKKAASMAMSLMYRYVNRPELLFRMSRLAREELLHFEQVLKLMQQRGIDYPHIGPARYAGALHLHVRRQEPERLVDTLIVGAFVEARSCERFAALAPLLDDELQRFYRSLLRSESRHFEDYLLLAETYAAGPITDRVDFFRYREALLINSEDDEFRFHSGRPRSISSPLVVAA